MISQVQRSGGRGLVAQTAAGSAGAGVLWRVWGERSPIRQAHQAPAPGKSCGGRGRQTAAVAETLDGWSS